MTDHYFSAEPAGPGVRSPVRVTLAGRELDVLTAGGVFSRGGLDAGTRVLLRAVPEPPAEGDLLDLGCGWGPVAIDLALRAPRARVWAVDVNPRALELTAENATRHGLGGVRVATPDEVPAGMRFAAIRSNPPIRIGKADLHALLLRWLPRLAEGGSAHLVVQKNLGADSLHRWLTEQGHDVLRVASSKGYRVLQVSPAGPPAPDPAPR